MAEPSATDLQLSTNRIVNNLLVENMNLGALVEALQRENDELRQQIEDDVAMNVLADTNGKVEEVAKDAS